MLHFSTVCRTASLASLIFLASLSANAQPAAPNTEQMIEQLKGPRTRSLRNLNVEAAAPPANAVQGAPSSPLPAYSTAVTTTTTATTVTSTPITELPAVRPSLSLLIQFDFNSARVRPESQQALANLSQALQSSELASFKFGVEGHTDAEGSALYNQKLSQSRAGAVRDFLVAQGVSDSRLSTVGKGASDLANPAEPLAPENRRVRIVNLD